MKLVIGLSGRIGAGKGTIADYLVDECNAESKRYSEILTDLLKRLYQPVERETLQKMGATVRTIFGEDVLVKAMQGDLEGSKADILLVDGVRYPNEVEMIHSFENNLVLFVDAPSKLRFKRVKKRAHKGEEKIDYKEFLHSEQRETEKFLDEVKDLSDYQIDNSGTFQDLYKQVNKALKEHEHYL